MSITFELEDGREVEPLNFSNPNAAALMELTGVEPTADGDVPGEQLPACVRRPLQAVNSEGDCALSTMDGFEAWRWTRSDEYPQRRAVELLALLVCASGA